VSSLTRWMDRSLYPELGDEWDNRRFRQYLDANIRPSDRLLDFGAGRGRLPLMNFRGRVAFAAGVDPEEAVVDNPNLDEGQVLPLPSGRIPYDDDSFDIVVSLNVLEHVEDPLSCFREIYRVLKPGGRFIGKTPGKWHYMPAVATLTPHRFHVFFNKLRGREDVDTFPTLYRCNSRRAVCRFADESGFSLSEFQAWEGRPEYLRMSAPTYLFGYLYERAVNATELLAALRCVIVFKLEKPEKPSAPRGRIADRDLTQRGSRLHGGHTPP